MRLKAFFAVHCVFQEDTAASPRRRVQTEAGRFEEDSTTVPSTVSGPTVASCTPQHFHSVIHHEIGKSVGDLCAVMSSVGFAILLLEAIAYSRYMTL